MSYFTRICPLRVVLFTFEYEFTKLLSLMIFTDVYKECS